ncbi:MAG: hypothetical protein QM784_18050 [Polyangiaceae bacterium]
MVEYKLMVSKAASLPIALSASGSKVPVFETPKESDSGANASRIDDESEGITDPFLDSLKLDTDADESVENDDTQVENVDFDPLLEPRDLNGEDAQGETFDVPIDLARDDVTHAATPEDDQGPDVDEPLTMSDVEQESVTDGAEEGPIEAPFLLPTDTTAAMPAESEVEEYTADPIGLYVDDVDLPWAKDRWAEHALGQTFSARRHVALVGSTLCVAGDATHLHDTRRFELLEELSFDAKTARVLALDPESRNLLLLTTAGKLLMYARSATASVVGVLTEVTSDMVTDLWQLAPGASQILVRKENGQLLEFSLTGLTPSPLPAATPARLVAMSELGEPRVSLWRSPTGLELILQAGEQQRSLRLTSAMERAASDVRPILVGFSDLVLYGARDHGLWICRASQLEFLPIPGCRSLTAITVGHLSGRPTAFVGLFSELEDRAEIACVDLVTGRASRISELCIHSDLSGPEDDPPELARIDSLVWDQSNGQLWAAGGFGLACFTQPSGSSIS